MFLLDVIHMLDKHHVAYAIAGGYAVALHGAVRGTVDIDLVITLNKSRYLAAETALREIGLEPRLPVSAAEVYEFREEYINNRNLTAWSFYKPDNPLELVDILITHNLKDLRTVTREINGQKIKLVRIDDLIAMKKQSGRPQDLEDVKALEKLR